MAMGFGKAILTLHLLVVLIASTTAWRHIPKIAVLPLRTRGGESSPSSSLSRDQLSEVAAKKAMGWFSAYATQLFQQADTNKDGFLDPNEVYELVLKFYVVVNRQAPIAPPSRKRVMRLLKQADTSFTGKLDISEFRRLLSTMYTRASSRVLAFKFVQMVVAPLSAMSIVHYLQRKRPNWLEWLQKRVCLDRAPQFLIKFLTKESLWVTIFTVIFVSQLAKMALSFVDWCWWGDKEKLYETMENLKEKLE